jgi:hypothetical protein
MRAKLLTDAVDEQLDAAAIVAHVHVELLFVYEQFANVAEDSPAVAFVK